MPVLFSAPHRVFFFTGMITALLSVGWWCLVFLRPDLAPAEAVPPVMAHPLVMSLGLFSPFLFGFLMTTYPRWMDASPISGAFYLPSALLQGAGISVFIVGLNISSGWAALGLAIHVLGWAWAVAALLRVTLEARSIALHVWGTLPALLLGLVTELLAIAFLLEQMWAQLWVAARVWLVGCLLPVFLSVSHRMIPFFSRSAVPGYDFYRPEWAFWAMLVAVAGILLAELVGVPAVRLPFAAVLAVVSAHLATRWQPWRCRRPMLLASLHIGFAWLPIGAVLLAASALGGQTILDAGIHAIALGYFASLLVAMVTRVTMGHSGRPLTMPPLIVALFWTVQIAAASRVLASLSRAPFGVLAEVALWLLVLVMVVFASKLLPVWLRPRLDGKPG
ncbi:MAG: NnrS family protein [Gammaproteobacteria bacterium]|nr:MAG: NnrS family protein [Gammaproteobacteria bacterium]